MTRDEFESLRLDFTKHLRRTTDGIEMPHVSAVGTPRAKTIRPTLL